MEDAQSYMESTSPASEGLFKLLNKYGHHKMRAIVDAVNSHTKSDLDESLINFSSIDVAREVISGSILQIAYMAIKQHAKTQNKSSRILHFEDEMNRLIKEGTQARTNKFTLPSKLCRQRNRKLVDWPDSLCSEKSVQPFL